jgi:hypothetical protein
LKHFAALKMPHELFFFRVNEISGMSELSSSVFLFDTEAEVLFYYYDDRGLDLCASRVETLQVIYERFNAYLLDYDRERMNSVFQNF